MITENGKFKEAYQRTQRPERESRKLIPFLEEPYGENARLEGEGETQNELKKELDAKKVRVLELETENAELKVGVENEL